MLVWTGVARSGEDIVPVLKIAVGGSICSPKLTSAWNWTETVAPGANEPMAGHVITDPSNVPPFNGLMLVSLGSMASVITTLVSAIVPGLLAVTV